MCLGLKNRSNRVVISLATAAVLMIISAGPRAARAQDPPEPNGGRVNLATSYKVDPSWPKRPDDADWSSMPGIAVDDKDQVYLFTRANPPVQVYDAKGKFIRGWGEGLVGSAHYLKIDHEGKIWVADMGYHIVMQFTPEGKLLKTLGTRGKPGNDESHFDKPTDMAVTPQGDVFISDGYGNRRVVHFDRNGKFVKQWGKEGVGPGEFMLPHAIALDSKGRLYVADRSNVRVQVFDQNGKFLDEWRDLIVPWGLSVTEKDEIWVCGSSPMTWPATGLLGCPPKDQVFMKFNTDGKLLQLWTVPKGEDGKENPGEVNWLHAAALDSHGNIYAGDIKGQRAQKFVKQE